MNNLKTMNMSEKPKCLPTTCSNRLCPDLTIIRFINHQFQKTNVPNAIHQLAWSHSENNCVFNLVLKEPSVSIDCRFCGSCSRTIHSLVATLTTSSPMLQTWSLSQIVCTNSKVSITVFIT